MTLSSSLSFLTANPSAKSGISQKLSHFFKFKVEKRLFFQPVNHVKTTLPAVCQITLPIKSCRFSTSALSKKYNVMFFGTDEFGLETLKKLHSEQLKGTEGVVRNLEVVCSSYKRLTPAVVKYARHHAIKVNPWPPPDDQLAVYRRFDIGIVASFGHLLPQQVIEAFPLGMLNVHGSLLPKLRGAAPVIHALKNGMATTGISIMRVRPKKFDIGDVLASRSVDILPDELRPELTARLAVVGADLINVVLSDLDHYLASSTTQDACKVTYAPVLKKHVSHIDFEVQTALEIYNLWRAVGDFMKLRAVWLPTSVSVRLATCLPPSAVEHLQLEDRFPNAVAGQAEFVRQDSVDYLVVRCKEGWLGWNNILYGKKKPMTPIEFYNGFLSKRKGELRFIKEHYD